MTVINWIIENFDNILAWIGGIVSCASIIVKLTKTENDDKVLGKIVSFLGNFSIFNTHIDQKIIDENKK